MYIIQSFLLSLYLSPHLVFYLVFHLTLLIKLNHKRFVFDFYYFLTQDCFGINKASNVNKGFNKSLDVNDNGLSNLFVGNKRGYHAMQI